MIPVDGVGGRREAERGRDDLPRDPQCLQTDLERDHSVAEERDVRHPQMPGEFLFEAIVVIALVGEPAPVPDVSKEFDVLVQRGERRLGDGDEVLRPPARINGPQERSFSFPSAASGR